MAGTSPGEVVFEDDVCAVILSISPLTPGHMLVVPRLEVDDLWDLEGEVYEHVMRVTRNMARRLEAAYDYARIGLLVEGFGVPHAHVHVFGYEKPITQTVIDFTQRTERQVSAERLALAASRLRR